MIEVPSSEELQDLGMKTFLKNTFEDRAQYLSNLTKSIHPIVYPTQINHGGFPKKEHYEKALAEIDKIKNIIIEYERGLESILEVLTYQK